MKNENIRKLIMSAESVEDLDEVLEDVADINNVAMKKVVFDNEETLQLKLNSMLKEADYDTDRAVEVAKYADSINVCIDYDNTDLFSEYSIETKTDAEFILEGIFEKYPDLKNKGFDVYDLYNLEFDIIASLSSTYLINYDNEIESCGLALRRTVKEKNDKVIEEIKYDAEKYKVDIEVFTPNATDGSNMFVSSIHPHWHEAHDVSLDSIIDPAYNTDWEVVTVAEYESTVLANSPMTIDEWAGTELDGKAKYRLLIVTNKDNIK